MAKLQQKDTPLITPEEYLARERASLDQKHEYVDGEIFAMVGASLAHIRISMNVAALLTEQLKRAPCRPYASDLKVATGKSSKAFFYPDFVIVCGKLEFYDGKKDIVQNPSAIIEILSPSTEAFDRGKKFYKYREIESFTDYILVSQDEPRIEHFEREDRWTLSDVAGIDQAVTIKSINCTLPLSEVYDRVWEE